MSDSRNIVTGLFMAIAMVLSVTAYVVYPKASSSGMEEKVNKPLFEFEPKAVRGLAIEKYDREKNRLDRVVMQNSLVSGWQIPSKFNYPVDSAEKLVFTAGSLSGLLVLGIASEDPTDEETYGVVEPAPGLKAGQEGVGIKVTLVDRSKKELASLIIGKEVKDQPGSRFVRIPNQRFIYVCKYDPSILDTDFFAWINPKVLSYGAPWTVAKLGLNKYTASKSAVLEVKKSYKADLTLQENQWTTISFVDAADPQAKSNLDVAELERIRLALENFEIQDVAKKDISLASSLKERKGIPVTFGVINKIEPKGFFVDEKQKPPLEFGAGGALDFTSSEGILYHMVFGTMIARQITGNEYDQRYVMMTASVDESMFPMPVNPEAKAAKKNGNDAPKPPGNNCEPELIQDDDDREARRQYQIKLEDRKQKIEAAQKVADQINNRFSDWFYVIDNELYKRLMPARASIISKNQ